MTPRSVLILSPDPVLSDGVSQMLAREGYRLACFHSSLGIMRLLRETEPDLLIVSLPHTHIRGNWRLIEQMHNDPTIKTKVIALIDRSRCRPGLLSALEDMTQIILDHTVDSAGLLNAVRSTIGQAAQVQPTPPQRLQWQRLRHEIDRRDIRVVSPKEIERMLLGLGQSGLPSETLDRVEVLSEQERGILSRTQLLSNREREEIIDGIDVEMERLWAQRRKDLMALDPNLQHLPRAILERSAYAVDQLD